MTVEGRGSSSSLSMTPTRMGEKVFSGSKGGDSGDNHLKKLSLLVPPVVVTVAFAVGRRWVVVAGCFLWSSSPLSNDCVFAEL